MLHKHVIASRRFATTLAAVVVLLCAGIDSSYAEAPFCSLRDPGHQIYEMFPKATGHRSVVGDINRETQIAVGKRIPFPLMKGEMGQHTLYVPVDDDIPLGYIQTRSELTDWGLAEIVWALNIQREVEDFRFQRCRGQACKSVLKQGLPELLHGRDQAALIALLNDEGELKAALASEMSEDERMLAGVVTRSAVKVIAVIESGWSTTVQELAQSHSGP